MISDHDKQHIDELVHNAELNADGGPPDENLSPEAAADAAELIRTRKLLADVSTDAPTPEETETMWQAIAATVGPDFVIDAPPAPSRRRVILQFAAATLAAAATLLIAFSIGQVEYKGYSWLPVSDFGLARRHVKRTPAARVAVSEPQARADELAGRPILGVTEAGDGNFWYGHFGVVEASEAGDGKLVLGDEVRERVAGLGRTAEGTVRGGRAYFDVSTDERYKDVEARGREENFAGISKGDGIHDYDDPSKLSYGYRVQYGLTGSPESREGETASVPEQARDRFFTYLSDGDGIPADSNADGGTDLGRHLAAATNWDESAGIEAAAKGISVTPTLGATVVTDDVADASVLFTLGQGPSPAAGEPAVNDFFAGAQVRGVGVVTDQPAAVAAGVQEVEAGVPMVEAVRQMTWAPPATPALKGCMELTETQGQSMEGVAVADGQPRDETQKYVADVTPAYTGTMSDVDLIITSSTPLEYPPDWPERLSSFYVVRDGEGDEGQVKEGVAVAGVRPESEVQEHAAGATYVADATGVQTATEEPQPPPPSAPAPVDRKIIKNGELTIEVAEYDPAADQVETIVRQHSAFVADREIQEKTGGAVQGILTIRVEPARFETLFAALKAVGRLESENVKAADVTAQYVDLEARITAAQLTEDNLKALLAQKSILDKITSMLEIERELARVRTEIEQMQGQLRVMAAQVSLSTIRVTLREPERIVPGAGISVEVADLDSARKSLGEALTMLNGRLLSAKADKREDGTLMGQFELQVTLANFDAFMTAIDGLGRVESRQIKDQQFGDALAPWAKRVRCGVNLTLYERSRQLPSGSITLEVAELPAAVQALDPLLEAAKAAITNNQTTRRDDGSAQAQISIRVPAGRFAGLVENLAPLGRLTGKAVAGEAGQITGGAANVLCDLTLTLAEPVRQVPSGRMAIEVKSYDTSRPALEKIIKDNAVQVLASASRQRTDGTSVGEFRLGIAVGHMESVVEKIEKLGRIEQRQIVGLGLGSLSKVDPKALGVIDIALFEKPTVAPPTEQAGGRIRDRLRDGLSGLYASLGLIVYGLVVMAPWLVLVVLAAWLFTRWLRKRRPRPAAAPAAKPTPKTTGQK